MIKEKCFTKEWLDQFKKQKNHRRIDKIILEKMIYALHLVEKLKTNGLEFVFKGGTSMVLLFEEGNRFSIDIDIICKVNRKELEITLDKVIKSSRFSEWKLDKHRSYKPGVPKAHYKFSFDTEMQGSGTILLDILIEDPIYPELIERPIITKWIETDDEIMIRMPSIDSITGDKLTAFAPNTIGIPYFKGEDKQPFSMEICKQLFDLSRLFEQIKNVEKVAESFKVFSNHEIKYRNNGERHLKITHETVLQDSINTCLIIAKRGKGSNNEKAKFDDLQKGIRAFGTGFLMTGHFRIDDAIPASARIAYLATKILVNDMSPIDYYNDQNIKQWIIEDPALSFLNRLKKQPDKSSFYYWYHSIKLLGKHNTSRSFLNGS